MLVALVADIHADRGAPVAGLARATSVERYIFLGDIVGFEMERMILPTLAGLHVPGCNAIGDFSV
jgi:hypothetical protein